MKLFTIYENRWFKAGISL